jgi:hypothetical protein
MRISLLKLKLRWQQNWQFKKQENRRRKMSFSTPHPTRKAQVATFGLGHHFVSPRKAQDKWKTQTLVELPGAEAKCHQLLAEIKEVMKPWYEEQSSQVLSPHPSHDDTAKHPQHIENDDNTALHFEDVEMFDQPFSIPLL